MIAQLDPLYIRIRPCKVISRLISYAFFEGRPLTTRGRWINPLVFALLSLERNLPQLKKVEKPIFILGTGRSGTTILGVVLSLHRDIGFLNEPKALWHAIYPEEDLVGNYTVDPARYRLGAEDATEAICRSAHRLLGAYLATVVSNRVLDKYPELIFRVPFVRKIYPDAKFIFLVRNGWDTCHSIQTWSKRFGVHVKGDVHDWWGLNNRKWHFLVNQLITPDSFFADIAGEIGALNRHVDMAAVEWMVSMREGLKWMKLFPDGVLMVRYEELIHNPEETLSGILEFCELPRDCKVLEYARRTLLPVPPKEPFDLHPAIRPYFDKIMQDLGYS